MVATTERQPLTPKQRRIFEYIQSYIDRHRYSPSIREVAAAHGISSPNGVVCHLAAIEKKGYITRVHGNRTRAACRTITVIAESAAQITVSDRGNKVVVRANGPVTFSRADWVAWLRDNLARAGETGGAK
jgi:predicted transcriptional regulator of viral defense system